MTVKSPLILAGVEYCEVYVSEADHEGYMLATRLRENGIDAWTGGRAARYVVVYVPVDLLEQSRAIRRTVFGS